MTSMRFMVTLTGAPDFLDKRDGERLKVDGRLAAESAAYLHGDYLDGRERHADDGGCQVAYLEVPLRAAPYGDAVLRRPPAGGGVRLDVALMDGLGSELALDGDVGLLEAGVYVADFEARVAGDVVGKFGMEQRRAVRHRVFYGGDGGQDFVLDVNEVESFFGFVGAVGGDGGYRVSSEQRLAARQNLAADVVQVLRRAAGGADDGLVLVCGEVRRRDHGADAGRGLRRARYLR